jgi:hypothetical protein
LIEAVGQVTAQAHVDDVSQAQAVGQLQRTHGNAVVQRMLQRTQATDDNSATLVVSKKSDRPSRINRQPQPSTSTDNGSKPDSGAIGFGFTRPPASKPTDDRTEIERLRKRQDCMLILQQFQSLIMARLDDWLIAAQNVGSAYAMAYDRHKAAVEAAARERALYYEIAFGVLTACCMGGLSWVSSCAQKDVTEGSVCHLLYNALEDTVQSAVGSGIGVVKTATAPQPQPVSSNPQVFQNEATNQIIGGRKSTNEKFASYFTGLRGRTSEQLDDLDTQMFGKSVENWRKQSDRLVGGPALPNVNDMADELERGMWARWAPDALRSVNTVDEGIVETYKFRKPGRAVEKRFDAVGITAASGVSDFGWWTTDKEIQQIVSWAESYKSKPFIK